MARGGAKRNAGQRPPQGSPAAASSGAGQPGGTQAGSAQQPPRKVEAPRKAQHHKPERSALEEGLFFQRIRKRAKWVFVFLALVFVASFVLFGVGSGSSGLGDLLNGSWIFGSGNKGSATPGVRKGLKAVAEHPKDPQSYRTLATAYQAAGQPDKAIDPLTKYTELQPKDSDALLELAALWGGKATRLTTEAQIKQTYPLLVGGTSFLPDSGTDIGKALAEDQVVSAAQSVESAKISGLYGQVNGAYAKQVAVYKKLVALDPQDSTLLVQLAQAQQQAGDTQGAIASYKQFLKIAPDDPSASAVKQQLQALEPTTSATTTAAATTTG